MHSDKISMRQLMSVAFVALLAPAIQLIPETVVKYGGRASWLAPLPALIPLAFLIWLFCRLMGACGDGEGFTGALIRILGTGMGKTVAVIYALWFIVYAGLMLRNGGERFLSTVYDNGNINIFIIITLLLVIIGAMGHLKALARSSGVFVIFLTILFVFIFLFAIPEIEADNLLPVTYLDTVPVFKASLSVIHVVSPFVYLIFLAGGVKREPKSGKTVSIWLGVLMVVITLLLVTTIGTFGEILAGRIQNTFFSMIRNITIFDIIERTESEVVGIWVVTDFVFLSFLIMAASEILRTVCDREARRGFVLLSAAAALLAAYLGAPNAFALTNILERVVPIINLSAIFIGLPLIYVIGRLRKKIE